MPGSTPARRSSRRSFRPMLVTIWMCTQLWSLICSLVTAFTLAACHRAFTDWSRFTRSTSSRRVRLPRAGSVIRMSRTASEGVIRAPRSARTLTGLPSSGRASWGSSSWSGASADSPSSVTPPRLLAERHDAPTEGERVVVPAGAGAHVVERHAVAGAVAVDRPAVAEVDARVVDGAPVGVHAVRRRAPEEDVARMQAGARDPLGRRQVAGHRVGVAAEDLGVARPRDVTRRVGVHLHDPPHEAGAVEAARGLGAVRGVGRRVLAAPYVGRAGVAQREAQHLALERRPRGQRVQDGRLAL